MSTGASAKREDRVQNLTTKQTAVMIAGMGSGRILVKLDKGGTATWERQNTKILGRPGD